MSAFLSRLANYSITDRISSYRLGATISKFPSVNKKSVAVELIRIQS
jgi:hypothetical protein